MRKATLASLLVLVMLTAAFMGNGLAYADSGSTASTDVVAIGIQLVIGVVLGFVSSMLGAWSSSSPWSNSKLAYTIIISTIAAIGIISSQFGGQVTATNYMAVILAVLGTGYVSNKGIQITAKLRARVKT